MQDVVVGDVVAVGGKTFRVDEICTDGLVSGPEVLVHRSNGRSKVTKMSAPTYFHGFGVEALEFVCGSRQAEA